MYTIHKTVLKVGQFQQIALPPETQFLHVAAQGHDVVLWYLRPESSDPDLPVKAFKFRAAMTGEKLPDSIIGERYLGTDQVGSTVVHVFLVD